MSKFNKEGDTIHGEQSDSHSRKILWKGLKVEPITKQKMTLYECDRNSYSEIIKDSLPKDCNNTTKEFHKEIGDSLEADAISIYIRTNRKIKITVKEGASGTHGAQYVNCRNYSISRIKTSLPCLLKSIEARKALEDKKDNNNKK